MTVTKIISLILIILAAGAFAAGAATYDVYPDGSGLYPTIQSAIDAAGPSGDGIQVHGGTYYEDNLIVDGKDVLISSVDGVAIVMSSVQGANTGITLRNVSPGTNLIGITFRGFEKGVVLENGSAVVWFGNVVECGTGVEVSGVSSNPNISACVVDSCGVGIDVIAGGSISIASNTIVNCSTGISAQGGGVTVSYSIIYGSDTGAACSGGAITFICNDFFLNTSDYAGCTPGADDFSEMPRFCFAADGSPEPYYLHIDSPCWAENNACGRNLGAFTQTHGCTSAPAASTTWGEIKQFYR
jgi:hypothetical protein